MGEHKRKGRDVTTPTKLVAPSARMIACRDAMIAAIRQEAADLPADQILAITAYVVGQMIALQDQRIMTSAMALDLVSKNIEAGNQDAQREVKSAGGTPQ